MLPLLFLPLFTPLFTPVPVPAMSSPALPRVVHVRSITTRGVWPLTPAVVLAGFDPPTNPWGSGHRGIDLASSPGDQVSAAADGIVTFAAHLAGRGVVVVDHGAVRSTYEPVQATVSVGDYVTAGDVIGTLTAGAGHCGRGDCLHWGLRRGDTYLDPRLLLGLRPVLKRV